MSISERTANTLRRLHSLTGILPVGAFLAFHLFVNYTSVQGPVSYRVATDWIGKLPFVILMELLVIAVPILFHMILGLLIIVTGQVNTSRFPYERNWGYVAQRVSGLYLVIVILAHVWTTRFSAAALGPEGDLFALMSKQLANPGVFVFYVLGVASAGYHLGNGLFGFAIHWGIVSGRKAQRRAAALGWAVGLALTLIGVNSLLGFRGHGVRLFERSAEATAVAHTEVQP